MNQQINLFQPIFRRERKLLSFDALLQISGILLLALFLLYGMERWQLSGMDATVTLLQQQQATRLTQLEQLTRQYTTGDEASPQARLQQLEHELQAQRYLISRLSSSHMASGHGFSAYLEGFARQVIDGVWLTGFRISAGGEHITLEGSSLKTELIPTFIQQLSHEPGISGTQFNQLHIERATPQQSHIDFVLYTGNEPESKP